LSATGGTNIYKGLQDAVELIDARENKNRNASILFFTDGVPDYSPARGEIEAMNKLKRQKKITYPLHAMGFGMYSRLDSWKIGEVAFNYGGMFSHIQDPTKIGTVFVNAISNIMTTSACDVKLSLKFLQDGMNT